MAENHARQDHVVDIAAAATQQPRIFEARDRLTQREITHGYGSCLVWRDHHFHTAI